MALALGAVIGGVLVGLWSWRAVFWFNLIFGALALIAAAIVLPENSDPVRARLDFPGFILGAVAIGCATFATIAGETSGYITSWILALYGASVLALAAFIVVELRAENPVLNLRFFRRRAFTCSTIVAFTSYFGIFSASAVASKSSASIQQIINKVVSAAYGAFAHGLDLALLASGALLLVSAVVAYFTVARAAPEGDD